MHSNRKARGVYWKYSTTVIVKPINVKKENSKQSYLQKPEKCVKDFDLIYFTNIDQIFTRFFTLITSNGTDQGHV